MTLTLTSVRVNAKARLVELLNDKLRDVQVTYGWPGADMQDECVWVGETSGPVTIPNYRAGRQARDDTFTITVYFWSGKAGTPSAQAAEARCEELYGALANICADDPTLGGLEGLRYAAQLGGTVDTTCGYDVEGGWAQIVAQIEIKSRLS